MLIYSIQQFIFKIYLSQIAIIFYLIIYWLLVFINKDFTCSLQKTGPISAFCRASNRRNFPAKSRYGVLVKRLKMCRGNATFRRFSKRLGDGRNAGMRVKTNNIILPHTGVWQHAYARIILLLPHTGVLQNAYTRNN